MVDLDGFAGPDDLRKQLSTRPVLVIGRNSGCQNLVSYRAAAADLAGALEALERRGLRLAGPIPTEERMVADLKAAQAQVSRATDGGRFVNRFVEYDLSATGAYLLLSAGTGRKLDDAIQQPFVRRLTQITRRINPGLLWSRRTDRLTRQMLALSEPLLVLQEAGGWLGDDRDGFRRLSALDNILTLLRASQAEEEAAKLPIQTRQGMARRTDEHMEDGRARYAVAHTPPPGFTRVRMRNRAGGHGDGLIVLDGPRWLPAANEVSASLPEVVDDQGNIVDQVANVSWALRHLYTGAWTPLRVARELVARRYSTPGLRRSRGPGAAFDMPRTSTEAHFVLRSIFKNLDVYESGKLQLGLGVEGVDDQLISDCFPPEGAWAEPADFARIRAAREREAQNRARHRRLVFAGIKTRVGDKSVRLRSWSRCDGQYYSVRAPDEDTLAKSKIAMFVSHEAFAASIIEALAEAGSDCLAPLLTDDESDQDLDLRAEINTLNADLDHLRSRKRQLLERFEETDPSGTPLLRGRMLRDINDRYDQITTVEIPAVEAGVRAAELQLADRKRRRAQHGSGVGADKLLRLVASLRDPSDLTYAQLWRAAICDLCFAAEVTRGPHKRTRVTVRWRGRIVVSDVDDRFAIAFAGQSETGAAVDAEAKAPQTAAAMAAGTCFDDLHPAARPPAATALAKRWGRTPSTLPVLRCHDPRITMAVATLFEHPDSDVAEIAKRLDEPLAFVERIGQVHTRARTAVWVARSSAVLAAALRAAATHGGLVTVADLVPRLAGSWDSVKANVRAADPANWTLVGKDAMRLRPCECGSLLRCAMRIREPIGLVCLLCRRDDGGLLWPVDPYDRWRLTEDTKTAR